MPGLLTPSENARDTVSRNNISVSLTETYCQAVGTLEEQHTT